MINQPDTLGFPQFAPLSTPFVTFLLERQANHRPPFALATSVELQVQQAVRQVQQTWSEFEQRLYEKRQRTYELMASAVQVDKTTGTHYVLPGWLRETLGTLTQAGQKEGEKKKEAVTAQTLSVWTERNLLRHRAWGQLDAQSVAGVLLARQLDPTRERSWLPGVVDVNEPAWWCYSQAMPTVSGPSPIVPCPMPLPHNLQPSTLLWTPWVGASWDPYWIRVGTLGAIRWAGASSDERGSILWNVSASDLKQWDPEISSLDMGFLKQTREIQNTLAQLTLLRLALTRLKTNSKI